MKYKFLGKPDRLFPTLKKGKVYDLEIKNIPWGLLDWIGNKQHPCVISPFRCPYTSWETFYKNWENNL